jgi:PAS domain S-box-containing protein
MEELSSGRSVPPFEYRLNHRSGTVRWVRNHSIVRYDEKGSFIGYDALVTDITERRNAEAALQKSERNFRNIFEKTNHGIIIVGMDGRILAANTAFSTVSGYAFDPSGILKVTDFVVPDQLEKLHERIAQRYNQVNLPPFEYKAMYNDGKLHVIEADGSMMDFNGQDAILVVLRDVTGVREAEQRVMEAIIQTEEAERSRIAQDLHDGLGPVLSTIKLYFQVYKDSSDAAKKEFLIEKLKTTIDEAIKAVSEISRNLSPHVLRNYGFYAAMLQFIHQIEHVNLIAFSVDFGNEPAMNSNTSIFLYRAVSELINNSIKHSGCSNISLRISVEKGSLIVEYGDDGQGFDVESVRANHASGSGLQNIINRIQALNGKVILQRGEIAGMRTIFTIPV